MTFKDFPRPEIVAPAGTPEKLRTALHFGADAVYLGLKRFSLRSFAGNFGEDELEWAIAYARERGRRVYVTVNVQPFDAELSDIEQALATLGRLGPDGVVIADPGVLAAARVACPGLRLHLSTQASVTNAAGANFWFGQGISRIVLARELSLEQLAALAPKARGELEVFVHGAVCVAWSGRCFLSLYWARPMRSGKGEGGQGALRDPRRGSCAQGCRWPYVTVSEARRPQTRHELAEDERGTYFFDAKDLCALPVLPRLVASGVRALKIEGRTRSTHYVGATVDVYRDALERLCSGDLSGFEERRSAYVTELARASKRGFSTHFLEGEHNDGGTYLPAGSPVGGEPIYVGDVVAAGSEHIDILCCNPIRPGEQWVLRDRGLVEEPLSLLRVVTPRGDVLEIARPGAVIRVHGCFRAGVGALVRSASPEVVKAD